MTKEFFIYLFITSVSVISVNVNDISYKRNLETEFVIVSTIDGRLSAVNAFDGSLLWNISLSSSLFTSTISDIEITREGKWVKMIPSLDGRLYQFDQKTLYPASSLTAETLLKSSFKFSDQTVVTGGIESKTTGLNLETGHICYECSLKEGCTKDSSFETNRNFRRLVVQSTTQTVRAVGSFHGDEKWNFSVTNHDIKVLNSPERKNDNKDEIRAEISQGILYSKTRNWKIFMEAPIVHVWRVVDGATFKVNVFQTHSSQDPTLYLGYWKDAFYIHENDFFSNVALPHIWHPYIIQSSDNELLTYDQFSESTALAVFYGTEHFPELGIYLCPSHNVSLEEVVLENEFENTNPFFVWWKELVIIVTMTLYLFPILRTCKRIFWTLCDYIFRPKIKLLVIERRIEVPVEIPIEIISSSAVNIEEKRSNAQFSSSSSSSLSVISEEIYESRFTTDYDDVECLGKGGFGVVFKCRNKIDELFYAVKRIKLPNSEESKTKVMREVKALAKLEHPNIVRYFNTWMENPPSGWQKEHDRPFNIDLESTSVSNEETETSDSLSYTHNDHESSFGIFFENSKNSSQKDTTTSHFPKTRHSYLYIVMQLCKKESLRDWLINNSFSNFEFRVASALSIFKEICLGVNYVHSEGLIHRDLKPNNIFFSETDGSIKIGDFGLVTRSSSFTYNDKEISNLKSSELQLTDRVGTELYMSPEQIAQGSYNHKVDIYSLGLIFYELLVPFSTQMERVTALQNLKAGLFTSSSFSTSLIHSLEFDLVVSMLSHRPEERPEVSDILNSKLYSHSTSTPTITLSSAQ